MSSLPTPPATTIPIFVPLIPNRWESLCWNRIDASSMATELHSPIELTLNPPTLSRKFSEMDSPELLWEYWCVEGEVFLSQRGRRRNHQKGFYICTSFTWNIHISHHSILLFHYYFSYFPIFPYHCRNATKPNQNQPRKNYFLLSLLLSHLPVDNATQVNQKQPSKDYFFITTVEWTVLGGMEDYCILV